MPDIVLNTNSFRVLFDPEIIDKIVSKRYHVYVARCAWEKESKGVYGELIQVLYDSARKLEGRFHENAVKEISLPNNLGKELRRNGASSCDMQIASLAYYRRLRSGQSVYLISSDPHFQNSRLSFERHEINVRYKEDFKNDC
jgi:hypothetical protein